jgi:membrane-bound lytic murein transglycosylase MltF
MHNRLGLARLGALILLATAACGRGTETPQQDAAKPSPATQTPGTPTPAPAPAVATEALPQSEPAPSEEAIGKMLTPWRGDLKGMVERRYIRMLVTFSKTNYFLDGPTQRGGTYDAGKLFEKFLNDRLQSKGAQKNIHVAIAFIPVSRDRLFQSLAEGKGDIAVANLTITPSRQKIVDFSLPVFDVREVVVTGAGEPPVATPEDLSGRKVHVRKSSSYFESLTALNEKLKASGKPPVEIVAANEPLENEDLLEMVNAGLIPATIVDDHTAGLWQKVFDQIRISDVAIRTGGEIAWALRKDTPELRETVNGFLNAHPKGSLQRNLILKKYLQDTQWVKNANSASEQKKYREMVDFFRRYGDKYDLPWLLVAAQAYQESTIDQSKKSSVGAVGVMQIKPSTAAGDPINITGVETSAEKNIEAGVKYLKWVATRYYNDPKMDRVTRGIFAIASYNAGPARVAQLRKKAAAMGLDPNKWFGNVEVVAAREIGRETVQYVSNIYKYYVAYSLISEQREERDRAKGPASRPDTH